MPSKGLAKRLAKDWPAKVLSLFAAILLSVVYRLNRLEDRYISVPLAVSLNESFSPASQIPRSVRVSLRGESNDLFAIQEGDIAATIDLSGYAAEGVYRVPVQIEKRGSALGVDPLEINADPNEVAVGIELRVSRAVPLTPSFRGFLAPGYELVSFELSPPEVEIFGPSSAVAKVDDVATDFIELAGRSADFSAKVRLVKKDGLVGFSGPDAAEFRAVVRKSLATRSLERLPVLPVGLRAGLELAGALPAGSMRVRSAGAEAAGFSPEPGALSVDLSSVERPGTYILPVLAVLPDGLAIEGYEPREVQVEVLSREEPR